MSAETVAAMKEQLGLNRPVWERYADWLGSMATGNFGYSIVTKQSIAEQLAVRIPNTILLVLPAYLTAYVLAIVLGLVAGSRRGSRVDRFIDSLASIGIALPSFWFAMMLIFVFGYALALAAEFLGMQTVGDGSPLDVLRHYILPFVTLDGGVPARQPALRAQLHGNPDDPRLRERAAGLWRHRPPGHVQACDAQRPRPGDHAPGHGHAAARDRRHHHRDHLLAGRAWGPTSSRPSRASTTPSSW